MERVQLPEEMVKRIKRVISKHKELGYIGIKGSLRILFAAVLKQSRVNESPRKSKIVN